MTRRFFNNVGVCACLMVSTGLAVARGEVRLSTVIGDNAVLQRDAKVTIWGVADPNEEVAVEFAGQSHSAAADRFGRWQVALDPMPASAKGRRLVVRGANNTLQVDSVYVGEVWLYLSQSWHLGGPEQLRAYPDSLPPICTMAPAGVWEHQNHAPRPLSGLAVEARWNVYKTPGRYFRNDGYYLGLGLTRSTGVPVGVMGLGASTLESMTPPEGFLAFAQQLGPLAEEVASWVPQTRPGQRAYLTTLGQIDRWVGRTRARLAQSPITFDDFTQPPALPGPPQFERAATTHYNFVTHRFTTAAIRGVIIQPKTFNVGDRQYLVKARALVHGLREVFGRQDLPVCFVQMHSPGRYEQNEAEDPDDWVRMRDAQNRLADIPHTTVVATYDLKSTSRSEPDIPLRAAAWAAAVVGQKPVQTGPSYRRHRVDGKNVIVEFDNVGGGLMVGEAKSGEPAAPDAAPGGFQVAGSDGQWHDAVAAIRGNTVVVACDNVNRPVAARYAWTPEPTAANLYNREGFPALPFVGP